MSKMRKLSALLVAMIMVFAMTYTAFAASITIKDTKGTAANGFAAYQIFTGDLSTNAQNEKVLSNLVWGSNVTATDGKVTIGETAYTAEEAAEAITAGTITTAQLAAIVTGDPKTATATTATGDAVISDLADGYYLVQTTGDVNKGEAKTAYIVQVAGDVAIEAKTDAPTVVKKVKDTNDSEANSTTGWQDSADYDVNDVIPYQITATLGDLSKYDKYYVEFTDTMSPGLTYNNDAAITIVGKDGAVTDSFTITTTKNDKNETVLKAICMDVKAIGATSNSQIVINYTCTLNENAVIGSAGNPNKVDLEYSNNPNNTGDGTTKPDTGKTPEDKNIVFTYKVVANKVTGDEVALPGAGFELVKILANGTEQSLGLVGCTKEGNNYVAVTPAVTTFEWNRLDDGSYKIYERVTPVGYNSIDPITFTVEAGHVSVADNPTLTSLTGGDLFSGDVATGAVTGNIVNQSGSVLPSTGGMGTTLFYVIGGILVVGAGVLLVSKRRMAR